MKKIMICCVILLLFPVLTFGAEIKAFVDTNVITQGDSVTLTIIVDDNGADIDISVLQDFKIMHHSVSNSFQMINMKTSHQYIHEFQLVPLKKGALTIPKIPVRLEGKVTYTDPIHIRISKNDDRKIYVTADISNSAPFKGEQFVYTFRLYTSVNLQRANLSKPDFNGFASEEMGESRTVRKILNGREYFISEMRYLLIPEKSGSLTISPAALECDIIVKNRNNRRPSSPFDSFFGSNSVQKKLLRTEALSVNAKALPDYQSNNPFSGLVGDFDITLKSDTSHLKQGDSATLTLTIQGTGNIKDAGRPTLHLPEGAKSYDDNPVEEIEISEAGYQGRKIYKTAIVPIKKGTLRIEPVTLTYFDVKASNYVTVHTDPVQFLVAPSTEKESLDTFTLVTGNETSSVNGSKKKVEFIKKDILPLKDDPDAVQNIKNIDPLIFILLLAFPPMAFVFFFLFKTYVFREKSEKELLKEKALGLISSVFKETHDEVEHISQLNEALLYALGYVGGKKTEVLSSDDGVNILKNAGFENDVIESFSRIFREIESSKFSGNSNKTGGSDNLHLRIDSLIKEITK